MLFSSTLWQMQSCVHCGRFFQHINILCDSCLNKIFLLQSPGVLNFTINSYRHTLYFLYPWNKHNDKWIRSLIYGLKGGPKTNLFDYYASQMYLNFPLQQPSPSLHFIASTGKHAHALTRSCSIIFNSQASFELEKMSHKTQKTLSAHDRKLLSIRTKSDPPFSISNNSQIILIDDLLTTGATAHACFQALGQPQSFAIWTLAYKEF